jgi:N-acetylglutamate synthase-like GNAT family acetyltransferase
MNSQPVIISASPEDLPIIEYLAKGFELDCEDLDWNQFVIAKRKNDLVAFGRLRKHHSAEKPQEDCIEIATVGVVAAERGKGVGTLIVKELISRSASDIFLTCVIPHFFEKIGFHIVKQFPSALQKKVDFCKSCNFKDDQIFIMKLKK